MYQRYLLYRLDVSSIHIVSVQSNQYKAVVWIIDDEWEQIPMKFESKYNNF